MAVDKKRAVYIASSVFLIGTLLAAVLAWRQADINREAIEQQLATETQRLIAQIDLRLQTYELGLRATRSVVQLLSPDLLNSENFRRFQMGRDINIEFPGARGFGFIRRVPVNEEADFLQAARADVGGEFTLQQLSPHQHDRYVIQYIEPIENNARARGLDIASESKRKMAAEHAAKTGAAILTAPISQVQTSGKDSRSFLLLLPIYQPGMPLVTPQQRLQATYGWTYAPLIIDEILANIDLQDNALTLAIADVTDQAHEPFYSGLSDDEAPISEVYFQQTQAFHGRDWQITTVPQAHFTQHLNLTSPLLQFLFGVLVSGLLAGMIGTFLQNQQRERQQRAEQERNLQLFNAKLEEQVEERTRLLESTHHDLHTILDNLPSMIGYWDTSVRIRFANRAYHQWFGVPFGTLPGKHIRELVNEEMYQRNQVYVDAVLKGIPQTFERTLPAPDGTGMRHALAYYLPDIIDNEVRGYYVLIHDVTELTENREKLSQVIRENEALLATIKSRSIYSVTDHQGVIVESTGAA